MVARVQGAPGVVRYHRCIILKCETRARTLHHFSLSAYPLPAADHPHREPMLSRGARDCKNCTGTVLIFLILFGVAFGLTSPSLPNKVYFDPKKKFSVMGGRFGASPCSGHLRKKEGLREHIPMFRRFLMLCWHWSNLLKYSNFIKILKKSFNSFQNFLWNIYQI